MDIVPDPFSTNSENRETADNLRAQAASCRRLAAAARTRAGRSSLGELADHFDHLAAKIDLSSAQR